jgi:Domain of unknown function DUF29
MATKIKPVAKNLYEEDFYVGSHHQAALLRERRFDDPDCAQCAVADASSLSTYSNCQEPRLGWRGTIPTQRSELLNDLTPSLHRHLTDHLPELCARARHDAAGSLRDHGEQKAADALPKICPYALDQITGDWLP